MRDSLATHEPDQTAAETSEQESREGLATHGNLAKMAQFIRDQKLKLADSSQEIVDDGQQGLARIAAQGESASNDFLVASSQIRQLRESIARTVNKAGADLDAILPPSLHNPEVLIEPNANNRPQSNAGVLIEPEVDSPAESNAGVLIEPDTATPDQPDDNIEVQPEIPDIQDRPRGLSSLYSVYKDGDVFVLVLPGLLSMDGEYTVGTYDKKFATASEALQAAETAKDETKERMEMLALERNFNSFAYIRKEKDGKFTVAVPGTLMIEGDTSIVCGSTYQDFPTWEEAKDFYLENYDIEQLSDRPLLKLNIPGDGTIAFTDLDGFDPKVNLSDKPLPIPQTIQAQFLGDRRDRISSTYENTVSQQGWERKMFDFVSNYLAHDGAQILEHAGITPADLRKLTPKQAVEIATGVVVALSKYKHSDVRGGDRSSIRERPEPTQADQSDALTLLREGRKNKDNPHWEGNGVCRNFASTVKAVFEALKAMQLRFNLLQNTYCTCSGGDTYRPVKKNDLSIDLDASGHAWNNFITVTRDGQADTTIVDATWAEQDLQTGEIQGLDYTMTRAEPMIFELSESHKSYPSPEQIDSLLNFYIMSMENPGTQTGGHASEKEQKAYLSDHLLKIAEDYDAYDSLAAKEDRTEWVTATFQDAEQEAASFEVAHIDRFWQLFKACQQHQHHDPNISRITTSMNQIVRNYLSSKESMSEFHARNFITKDPVLQQRFCYEMRHREGYQDFLRESPTFRVRVRESMPGELPTFDPENRSEDKQELNHLVNKSYRLSNSATRLSIANKSPSELYQYARNIIQQINPEQYQQQVANRSDYEIVKNFDLLCNGLSENHS